MRPAKTGERLAQCAAGEDVFETERLERVEEHDIEIAAQTAVLESIIKEQQLRIEILDSHFGGGDAIAVLYVRNGRQRVGKLQCFVVVLTIGRAVAAADNHDPHARILQPLSQPLDHGRLPGAAQGEITDADHGHIHPVHFRRSAVVTTIAQADRERV